MPPHFLSAGGVTGPCFAPWIFFSVLWILFFFPALPPLVPGSREVGLAAVRRGLCSGPPVRLWTSLGPPVRLWTSLGPPVRLWTSLGPPVRLWTSLGPPVRLWTSLGPPVRLWTSLGPPVRLWTSLGHSGCAAVCLAPPTCLAVCLAPPTCLAVCLAPPTCLAVCLAPPTCLAVCLAPPSWTRRDCRDDLARREPRLEGGVLSGLCLDFGHVPFVYVFMFTCLPRPCLFCPASALLSLMLINYLCYLVEPRCIVQRGILLSIVSCYCLHVCCCPCPVSCFFCLLNPVFVKLSCVWVRFYPAFADTL
ncbi:uncharacterized protein LOC132863807 [Tachysurus vachellii]|uniref:uncharacterized protein LOC132863807 n=1 Tax=Tachysurus vachellii TaxID=175792 RepID=UPI00296B2219|nr:uncharacterized protein LOC132863807 [Tachysurus vachellii]